MSYCGRCGGFYNEQCPHWPPCSPAESPYRQAVLIPAWIVWVALISAAVSVAGMVANFMLAVSVHR